MNPEKAYSVFDTNKIEATWDHNIGGKIVKGISLTRNSALNWQRPVKLVFDQLALSNVKKIIPLDGEYVFRKTRGLVSQRERIYLSNEYSESAWREEYVVDDINNLNRYIVEIRLQLPSMNKLSYFDVINIRTEAEKYCSKWNIPLIVSEEYDIQFDKIKKHWNET